MRGELSRQIVFHDVWSRSCLNVESIEIIRSRCHYYLDIRTIYRCLKQYNSTSFMSYMTRNNTKSSYNLCICAFTLYLLKIRHPQLPIFARREGAQSSYKEPFIRAVLLHKNHAITAYWLNKRKREPRISNTITNRYIAYTCSADLYQKYVESSMLKKTFLARHGVYILYGKNIDLLDYLVDKHGDALNKYKVDTTSNEQITKACIEFMKYENGEFMIMLLWNKYKLMFNHMDRGVIIGGSIPFIKWWLKIYPQDIEFTASLLKERGLPYKICGDKIELDV